MKTKRMVRWDVRSESTTGEHDYRFVIIGDDRQNNRIRQKFLEMAQPTEDDHFLTEGDVPDSDLKFAVLAVKSYGMTPTQFATSQRDLYDADIKRNTDICARKGDSSLVKYVETKIADGEMPFCR